MGVPKEAERVVLQPRNNGHLRDFGLVFDGREKIVELGQGGEKTEKDELIENQLVLIPGLRLGLPLGIRYSDGRRVETVAYYVVEDVRPPGSVVVERTVVIVRGVEPESDEIATYGSDGQMGETAMWRQHVRKSEQERLRYLREEIKRAEVERLDAHILEGEKEELEKRLGSLGN